MTKIKREALEIFKSLMIGQNPQQPIHQEHEVFLLSWMQEHGLGGFFGQQMTGFVSEDLKSYITSCQKLNTQRNLIFLQEFHTLTTRCQQLHLPTPVALKGLALLQRVHSLSERSLTDIDIYLPPGSLQEIEPIIYRMGYLSQPQKTWKANHHKKTFTKKTMGLEITLETHNKLFYNQPADFIVPLSEYMNRTQLSPEIELVYLSAHLVHQHSFLKLFWLLDIYRLTVKHPEVWSQKTWDLAHQLRVKTSLHAVAHCMNDLFHLQIETPKQFLPIKYFLNWKNLILLNENRWKYLCIKHTAKDTVTETLSYDLKWLYFLMEKNLFTKSKDRDINL